MKGLKICLAAFCLVGASLANATYYNIVGNLTAYSATIPTVGNIFSTFDPVSPALLGSMTVDNLGLNTMGVSVGFVVEYFNAAFASGSVVKTVPKSLVQVYSSPGSSVFNSTTNHISSSLNGLYYTRDAFCVGVAAICGKLYPEGNDGASGDMRNGPTIGNLQLDFYPLLNNFSGTLVLTDSLAGGVVVSKTYSITGSTVPLPMSGALFGFSLMVLAKVRRSRAL